MGANDVLALDANFCEWKATRMAGMKKEINAFEYYSIDQFLRPFGLSDEELQSGLIGGSQDGGVDALYFFVNRKLVGEDSDLDSKTAMKVNLLIIQSKEGHGFSPTAIDKLYFFADDLLDLSRQSSAYKTAYKPQLLDLIQLFKAKYKMIVGAFPQVAIDFYYITKLDVEPNQDCAKSVGRLKAKVKEHFGNAVCELTYVNAERLWSQVQVRPKRAKTLKWAAQPLETPEGPIGLVLLPDYYNFLKDEHGDLAERIFESNVRGFWQNTSVNKRIKATLESPGLADFWLLNNGITVLAANTSQAGFTQLEVDDPQIVNGLQTSRQIFNYYQSEKHPPAPDYRRVLVRVIKTQDKAIRDDVIRATNSQNKMPEEALRATDPIHRQIEALFAQYNLFYDRRKGQYKDEGKPISQIVTVVEVLQAMLAIVLKRPDDARARPRNYFSDDSYDTVFGEDVHELTVYLRSVQIARLVDDYLVMVMRDGVHYRNVKFYVCMYVACAATNNAYGPVGDILKIDMAKIPESLLNDSYLRVLKQYRRMALKFSANGEPDYDALAKGPHLLKAINTDLKRKFAGTQKKARAQTG